MLLLNAVRTVRACMHILHSPTALPTQNERLCALATQNVSANQGSLVPVFSTSPACRAAQFEETSLAP